MITTTTTSPIEKKATGGSESPVNARVEDTSTFSRKPTERKRVLVGFDLGTNASCVLAGGSESKDVAVSKIIPTIVGYAREGLVDGIIANNATTLIGEEALAHRLQLKT